MSTNGGLQLFPSPQKELKISPLRPRLAKPQCLSTVVESGERSSAGSAELKGTVIQYVPSPLAAPKSAPAPLPSAASTPAAKVPGHKRTASPGVSIRAPSPALSLISSRGPSPAFYTPPRSRTPSVTSERKHLLPETPDSGSYFPPRTASLPANNYPPSPTPGHMTPPASPERLQAPLPPTPQDKMTKETFGLFAESTMSVEPPQIYELMAPIPEVVSPIAEKQSERQSVRSSALPTPKHSRHNSPIISEAATSPTLVQGNNSRINSTIIDRITKTPMKMHLEQTVAPSIFPEYDHEKPLQEQRYRPTRPPPRPLPGKSRSAYPTESTPSPMHSFMSARSMPLTNDMPFTTSATDLYGLWAHANGQTGVRALPIYRLQMHRECASPSFGTTSSSANMTFGPSPSDAVYSISAGGLGSKVFNPRVPELTIERHCPTKPVTIPVTQFSVDANYTATPSLTNKTQETFITSLHPKLAILLALDAAAQSPEATSLAKSDPNAESPAAARIAQQAVLSAVEQEGCGVTWTPNHTGYSTMAGQGHYTLHHPRLGDFPIEVRGDISRLFDPPQPVAAPNGVPFRTSGSISVLFPGTTRDEINPYRLTTLDIGAGALTIDTNTLTAFGSLYIMDMCVAALFAVAAAETQKRVNSTPSFAAPPKSATMLIDAPSRKRRFLGFRHKSKSKSAGGSSVSIKTSLTTHHIGDRDLRPKTAGGRLEQFEETSDFDWDGANAEEMPAVTKAALSGLLLGFKGAVWVLGTGVTLAAEVVIGVSSAVTKK